MNDKSALLNQLRIDRKDLPPPGGGKWRLWAAGGLAAIVVVIGVWIALSPSGVPVHAATVRAATGGTGPSAAGSLLDASGYVVARRSATVSAKIAGKLVEVLVEEGKRVEKDQVIARLDDSNLRAAREQAEARVAEAKANLAAAQVAYADIKPIHERNEKLLKEGWVSQTAYDQSKSRYNAARAAVGVNEQQLAVAEAALAVAQRAQDDATVRAPFSGVVTVKAAQPGEIVSPISAGGGGFTRTGIATIVDMDSLEVEVDVSENFINRVHSAQPATVRLNAYPDWQIPAEVIAVIPTADRSKATVKVRVALKEKDARIVPEMGARVSFLNDAPAETAGAAPTPGVIVPTDAVQANGETGIVFVIQGSKVERRAVKLGARNAEGQTVLSGLQSGMRVAAGDLSKLSDGAKIYIEE